MLAIEINDNYMDKRFIAASFARLPKHFKPAINAQYIKLFADGRGRTAANLSLLDMQDKFSGKGKIIAELAGASDDEICAYAEKMADMCFDFLLKKEMYFIPGTALEVVLIGCRRAGFNPVFKDSVKDQGRLSRLLCKLWWRRQIRREVSRQVEAVAIDLGMVSKRAGIYASDEAVDRRRGQRARNKSILESIVAVNDEGQEYTLQELSDLGVSNPEIRRMELMTRIDGFDKLAVKLGHAAEFYTITAPSKFHAVRSDGKKNPKYDSSTPREAQQHLCKGWALSRAALAKQGIKLYGFRVVEPHHDGTPHWHMVIFFENPEVNTAIVREVLRGHALREDGDEFGAAEHRFKAEKIDRSKGSAAGYLAKYISKNINGQGMDDGMDYEGGKVSDNARRVDAWASCWGVRQFQQIGGAPVGVWRELRRLGSVENHYMGMLERLQEAANAAEWHTYTALMGGATAMRKDMAARVRRVWFSDVRTRYDGEGMYRVEGVETVADNYCEKTRLRRWFLKRADLSPAWSSVNNCNRGDEKMDWALVILVLMLIVVAVNF